MRRGRTERVLVERYDEGVPSRLPDEVVVEEPLEIRLDGHVVATTMRTPGNDYELAVGLCISDGLLGGASVLTVRYCGQGPAAESEYNVVTVETGGLAPIPEPRIGTVSSSCGLCGTSALTEIATRIAPINVDLTFQSSMICQLVKSVSKKQEMYGRTGGLHAAAVFDVNGEIELVREDIGRHNAVDKVVGRRFLDGITNSNDRGLFVTSRASFEMVQKAWAAGFGILVAASAPSSLAIEAARTAGITLVGFVREHSMNVYSGELRDTIE